MQDADGKRKTRSLVLLCARREAELRLGRRIGGKSEGDETKRSSRGRFSWCFFDARWSTESIIRDLNPLNHPLFLPNFPDKTRLVSFFTAV